MFTYRFPIRGFPKCKQKCSSSWFRGSSQDEEINQQSQLAEKLKQQMLDQEEVSAGGLMTVYVQNL